MKVELLALMFPSSCDLESIGSKNHNAVTSDDINIKLSYSKITDAELNLLLAKFLDDSKCRSELFWGLYDFVKGIIDEKYAKRYLEVAIMERVMSACPFCNGTGVMIFKDKIETCSHCKEGNFIYSNDVVANLIGIKPQKLKKKAYNEIINKLMDIEDSALSKIGDT